MKAILGNQKINNVICQRGYFPY